MKKKTKNLTIILSVMVMLFGFTINSNGNVKNHKGEDTPKIEEWMLDVSYYEDNKFQDIPQDTIKKPMLAITPDGDTVEIYINDIIKEKPKKEKEVVYNIYNTYNEYNNYDYYKNWRFCYNDNWLLGSRWYRNYYHVYYPIVYYDVYYSPVLVRNYYRKHRVTIANNNKYVGHRNGHRSSSKYVRSRGTDYRSSGLRSKSNNQDVRSNQPKRTSQVKQPTRSRSSINNSSTRGSVYRSSSSSRTIHRTPPRSSNKATQTRSSGSSRSGTVRKR